MMPIICKRYFAVKSIFGTEWNVESAFCLFGIPMGLPLFDVEGPFEEYSDASRWCHEFNRWTI